MSIVCHYKSKVTSRDFPQEILTVDINLKLIKDAIGDWLCQKMVQKILCDPCWDVPYSIELRHDTDHGQGSPINENPKTAGEFSWRAILTRQVVSFM
jgi:hypothetical protein